MMRIYYGDDRGKMLAEAGRVLGEGHEVVSGEEMGASDMVNVFAGVSLFAEKRRILVKNLSESREGWGELPKYVGTENEVVVVEDKVDKRGVVYKALAGAGVEVREFRVAEAPEKKLVFDVLDTAMRGDGRRAVEMAERLEGVGQDAYMFLGLLVSQAIKKLEMGNRRARGVIAELARADLLMKRSGMEPWLVVKGVLVKIAGR